MKNLLYLIASIAVIGIFVLIFRILWNSTTLDALSILAIDAFIALGIGIPIFIWVDEKTRSRKHKSW